MVVPLRVQVPQIDQVLRLVECGAGVSTLPRMAVARSSPVDVSILELGEA